MFIIFFIWQSYAKVLLGSLKKVYMWINDEAVAPSKIDQYTQQISEYSPDITFIITSTIFVYGISLIPMLLGIFSMLVLFKAYNDKKLLMNRYILTFSIGFSLFYFLYN